MLLTLMSVSSSVSAVQRGNVGAMLDEIDETLSQGKNSHLGQGPLDRWSEELNANRKRWDKDYGIRFSLEYAPIYHYGTQDGPDNKSLNQGLDFYLRWENAMQLDGYSGSLDLLMIHRKDDLLSTNTQQFNDSRNSVTSPNDANVEGTFNALANLSWESLLLNEQLDITLGQFYIPGMFDENDILGNDRSSFMAGPLSNNPARVIPDSEIGMGMGVWYSPHGSFTLGAAITQAEADGKNLNFDKFNGNWTYMAAFDWSPKISNWGQGNYRFTYSTIDATGAAGDAQSSSRGFNISIDQELGSTLAFALRYADNDGKRQDIEKLLSAAIVFKQVLGYQQDELGFASFWIDPA
ncbi:MAG: hypothetical protein ACC707_13310, partial [Thiohalomonadales bacterium]